jgi:hypothetical protein
MSTEPVKMTDSESNSAVTDSDELFDPEEHFQKFDNKAVSGKEDKIDSTPDQTEDSTGKVTESSP